MQFFSSYKLQADEKKPFLKFPEKFVRQTIIFLISLYQKYISPFKGFSCAYRVLYRAEPCSCYVKQTFLEQDLVTAIRLSGERFRKCSESNYILNNLDEEQAIPILMSADETDKYFLGRRKFIGNALLGFIFPVLGQARFQCCFDICAGSKQNNDRNK